MLLLPSLYAATAALVLLNPVSASPVELATTPLARAAAVPFEITPGPGLPSLASLNLTMTELLDPNFLQKHKLGRFRSDGARRNVGVDYKAVCQGNWGEMTAATACRNYLFKLDGQACTVSPGATFCVANDRWQTKVIGLGASVPSASSACRDVACATDDIIHSCSSISMPGCGPVGGQQFACGNGYLQVRITGHEDEQNFCV